MSMQALERPQTAVITVMAVLQPKGPKRPGHLKDQDGVLWSVWPEKLGQYQIGRDYEVEYEMNGTYRNVKGGRAATPPGPAPDNFVTMSDVQRNSRPTSTVANGSTVGTRKAPMDQQNYYKPTSPEDKKSMFRCACVTAFIRAGQLRADRNEIAAAVSEIDAGYDMAVTSHD